MLDLSIFPCSEAIFLNILSSPIKPRRPCACNMAYTHCMRTARCVTPDHHGLPHNVELSWLCATRENTILVFVRDHPIYDATIVYLTYKQSIGCTHNNTQSNDAMNCDVTWSMRLDLHGAMCLAPGAPAWFRVYRALHCVDSASNIKTYRNHVT